MQYHAPATQPPTGSDTLDISVNDNGNTGTGSSTTIDTALIPINSINNAPVITFDQSSLPPSMLMQMEEDNSYVLTSKLSVSDDAEGADALTMTITVKSGVGAVSLKASSLAALTFSTGDGTNDDSLVCDGTLTELNAALSELTFIPATHYYGISASAISVTVEDNGHATSAAGPASLSHTIAIGVQVLAVNDAPVITAPATASVQEASDFLFSSAGATTVSLVDVDADDDPEGLVRCTITSDNAAARVSVHSSVQALHFVSPSSVGGSWSTGIASQAAGRWPVFAALSFYGSAASVNAALHTLVVHTPSSSSGACPYDVDLTITVNDQGYSCGGADCATSVVDADGTDDGKLTAEHTITITVTCPV